MDVVKPEVSQPRILMCPPDYFGIEYEINAWMNRGRPVDPRAAERQWNALHAILLSLDVQIELVEPKPGMPDLVFTANAAAVRGTRCVLSRFRPEQRRPEEPIYAECLKRLGFEVLHLPSEMFFEGAGDALFCGTTLFAGYRIRSRVLALQTAAQLLDSHVIPLELTDARFYHLDTCFCPVSPELVIWFPPAFDSYAQTVIESQPFETIALREAEAAAFGANAVVVGANIIANEGCPQLATDLKQRGYNLIQTPLHEFTKSGGSAKCLTLRLDGEDASRLCQVQWNTD